MKELCPILKGPTSSNFSKLVSTLPSPVSGDLLTCELRFVKELKVSLTLSLHGLSWHTLLYCQLSNLVVAT